MDMTVSTAQHDMRVGYLGGAPGILASAVAWGTATAVAALVSPTRAVWALLIGGALIHPVGVLLCRLLGAPARHTKGNPLGQLAGASTFWLISSLPLAYVLGLRNPAWFFAAMLLVIGGRYTVFATLYGTGLYWALGLVLAGAGFALAAMSMPPAVIAGAGAAIELAFAVACWLQHRQWLRHVDAPGLVTTRATA